jgi:PAS domain S-box-containing protein
VALPWGEPIVVAEGQVSAWRLLSRLADAGLLALVLLGTRRLRGRGERRRAGWFGASLFLFLLGVDGYALMADLEAVPPLDVSPYGLLLVALGLSYDLIGRLSASASRWRTIAAAMPVLVATTDRAARIDYVNPRFEALSGYPTTQLVGQPLIPLLSSAEPAHLRNALDTALTGSAGPVVESVLRTRDGTERIILAVCGGLPSGAGAVTGTLLIGIDVTEQRRAEAARDATLRQLQGALQELEAAKAGIEDQVFYLEQELTPCQGFEDMVGQSHALKTVLAKIEQVAPSSTTVLIQGETGVGKELVARAVHRLSDRHDRPLIKVNCAALPPTLIEAELFGYEKGAFTGADRRHKGYFEIADGGSLFLDEIGELPLSLQPKLLEVLQSGEIERIGGDRRFRVDVRIIAATNRRLQDEVRQGRFREDLYFRLNAYPITVPPLRQRKDDIPLLVNAFVNRFAEALGKRIERVPQAVMARLLAHDWPGNVRELENVIRRALLATSGNELHLETPLAEDGPEVVPHLPAVGSNSKFDGDDPSRFSHCALRPSPPAPLPKGEGSGRLRRQAPAHEARQLEPLSSPPPPGEGLR